MCHTLPKRDLDAMTAKRWLLYVSRYINSVVGCNLSHTLRIKVCILDFSYNEKEVIVWC